MQKDAMRYYHLSDADLELLIFKFSEYAGKIMLLYKSYTEKATAYTMQ